MSGVKYQIFISSTYEDLKEERDAVIRAVLKMGHFPVGMEQFSAADEEQWKIIQRHIDGSDYHVVLIAHRYGSTLTDGLSYTEREYDYAVKLGIPTLGFLIHTDANWKEGLIEYGKKAQIDAFKEKVKKKPVSFWKSSAELHGQVVIALMKQIEMTPRPGWIRDTNTASLQAANEIARLSAGNAALRQQIGEIESPQHALDGLAEYLQEGRRLKDILRRDFGRGADRKQLKVDGEKWAEATREYIKKELGMFAVTEFETAFYTASLGDPELEQLHMFIGRRIEGLEKIVGELKTKARMPFVNS